MVDLFSKADCIDISKLATFCPGTGNDIYNLVFLGSYRSPVFLEFLLYFFQQIRVDMGYFKGLSCRTVHHTFPVFFCDSGYTSYLLDRKNTHRCTYPDRAEFCVTFGNYAALHVYTKIRVYPTRL